MSVESSRDPPSCESGKRFDFDLLECVAFISTENPTLQKTEKVVLNNSQNSDFEKCLFQSYLSAFFLSRANGNITKALTSLQVESIMDLVKKNNIDNSSLFLYNMRITNHIEFLDEVNNLANYSESAIWEHVDRIDMTAIKNRIVTYLYGYAPNRHFPYSKICVDPISWNAADANVSFQNNCSVVINNTSLQWLDIAPYINIKQGKVQYIFSTCKQFHLHSGMYGAGHGESLQLKCFEKINFFVLF